MHAAPMLVSPHQYFATENMHVQGSLWNTDTVPCCLIALGNRFAAWQNLGGVSFMSVYTSVVHLCCAWTSPLVYLLMNHIRNGNTGGAAINSERPKPQMLHLLTYPEG